MVLEKIVQKYIRLKSATFWIGMLPIAGGVIEFVDTFTSLGLVSEVCRAAFGGTSPFMLVLIGSGTITMRAAMPDIRSLS